MDISQSMLDVPMRKATQVWLLAQYENIDQRAGRSP